MWLSLLLALSDPRADIGTATIYYPGDGHCGKITATGRPFRPSDNHIAHRTLRLNTRGVVCNIHSGRCVRTRIGDRGPYGSMLRYSRRAPSAKGGIGRPRQIRWKGKRYWYQTRIRARNGWVHRGTFDLTRSVAKAIGHRAFQRVIFFVGTDDIERAKFLSMLLRRRRLARPNS